MNVMKTTLTTSEVAGILFERVDEVNQRLADMLADGLISGSDISAKIIDLAASYSINIKAIAALGCKGDLSPSDMSKLLEAWEAKHQIEVKAYIRKERQQRAAPHAAMADADHKAIVRAFFADKPGFMRLVDAPGAIEGCTMGMIREADALVIGTSTKVITLALDKTGITSRRLITALKAVTGATSLPTKRFGKEASKATVAPILALRTAIHGTEAQAYE